MSNTLSHTLSPLEQTRKNKTVKLANSSRQLNAADQTFKALTEFVDY